MLQGLTKVIPRGSANSVSGQQLYILPKCSNLKEIEEIWSTDGDMNPEIFYRPQMKFGTR